MSLLLNETMGPLLRPFLLKYKTFTPRQIHKEAYQDTEETTEEPTEENFGTDMKLSGLEFTSLQILSG